MQIQLKKRPAEAMPAPSDEEPPPAKETLEVEDAEYPDEDAPDEWGDDGKTHRATETVTADLTDADLSMSFEVYWYKGDPGNVVVVTETEELSTPLSGVGEVIRSVILRTVTLRQKSVPR